MIERKNGSPKTIAALDDKEAIRFVLDALTKSYIGDVPEPNYEHEDQNSKPTQQDFWMEEVKPTDRISPVYGVVGKETGSRYTVIFMLI